MRFVIRPLFLLALMHSLGAAQTPADSVAVTFRAVMPSSPTVYVPGSFNNWGPNASGVISPGGVGYDINCGVRLLASNLDKEQVLPYLDELATALYQNCPSGVGTTGQISVSESQLDQVLEHFAKERDYAVLGWKQ